MQLAAWPHVVGIEGVNIEHKRFQKLHQGCKQFHLYMQSVNKQVTNLTGSLTENHHLYSDIDRVGKVTL